MTFADYAVRSPSFITTLIDGLPKETGSRLWLSPDILVLLKYEDLESVF